MGLTLDERHRLDQIKAKYPNIKVVDIQYGGGDHLKSAEIAKTLLQAHPKLKGIFGANEGSAIGVLNGAKETKRKIVIIGYDSGKQQKAAIASGEMAGANVALKDLPPYLPKAFIAIEDRRFYSHWGVDPRGVARAFVNNLGEGGTQGGSPGVRGTACTTGPDDIQHERRSRPDHRRAVPAWAGPPPSGAPIPRVPAGRPSRR